MLAVTLAGAAATWTNTVNANHSLRLPPSQELYKKAAVPGKGRVSPSSPTAIGDQRSRTTIFRKGGELSPA